MARRWWLGLTMLLLAPAAPSAAAVRLGFYSRDFGSYYPHAFVRVTGATDADPERAIDANYGFTARGTSPAILFGPVRGEIISVQPNYVASSERHFSLTLSDAQYAQLLALVEQWRAMPGRSYDLHRRNCVFFVKAVAELFGLRAEHVDGLMLKPRSFLDEVGYENAGRVDLSDSYVPKLARGAATGAGRQSLQSVGSEQPVPPPPAAGVSAPRR